MTMFKLDTQKCNRDMLCVGACPVDILIRDETTGYPVMRPGFEHFCIHCQHCAAICPRGAASVEPVPLESSIPLEKLPAAASGEAAEIFLRTRRSVREFKSEPLERALLARLMDALRWAPTAINLQDTRFIVIERADEVQELAAMTVEWMKGVLIKPGELPEEGIFRHLIDEWHHGRDMVMRKAPHLIVAVGPDRAGFIAEDSAIALTYLELAAHAWGVGCCWAGFFTAAARRYGAIRDFLGLAGDEKVFGGQMLGRAAHAFRRLPWRAPRNITWR